LAESFIHLADSFDDDFSDVCDDILELILEALKALKTWKKFKAFKNVILSEIGPGTTQQLKDHRSRFTAQGSS
jgi:hypothetical protein